MPDSATSNAEATTKTSNDAPLPNCVARIVNTVTWEAMTAAANVNGIRCTADGRSTPENTIITGPNVANSPALTVRSRTMIPAAALSTEP